MSRARLTMISPQAMPRTIVSRVRLRSATPEGTQRAGHPAAEHIRHTAAASLVQQNEQNQQQADHQQQDLESDR